MSEQTGWEVSDHAVTERRWEASAKIGENSLHTTNNENGEPILVISGYKATIVFPLSDVLTLIAALSAAPVPPKDSR